MGVIQIIEGKPFKCVPFIESALYNNKDTINLILSIKKFGHYEIIDIIETDEEFKKIEFCNRKNSWERKCHNRNIWLGIYEMPINEFSNKEKSDFIKLLRDKYIDKLN